MPAVRNQSVCDGKEGWQLADSVFQAFLSRQYVEAQELSAASDVVELLPFGDGTQWPDRYLAQFTCNGVVRSADGAISVQLAQFLVGIVFPGDYLRAVEPMRIITWLGPRDVVHPNVKPPWVCLGRISPGTGLVDLLYQVFEIITYQNFAAADALDSHAAEWARRHQHLLPVDRRPLKRRTNLTAAITSLPQEHKP
jgi:hypothetical protein